jgi:hypothetical protein
MNGSYIYNIDLSYYMHLRFFEVNDSYEAQKAIHTLLTKCALKDIAPICEGRYIFLLTPPAPHFFALFLKA